MRSPSSVPLARTAALVALGTLTVHQLRYLLAYRSDASQELAAQGHAYLSQVLPILLALSVALAAAGVLRAALRGFAGRSGSTLGGRAAMFAVAIFAAFSVQEVAECMVFEGHLSGLAAVFGAGAWIAVPLALVLGGLCALLDLALERLERFVGGSTTAPRLPRAPRGKGIDSGLQVSLARLTPLAFGLARRPPPVAAE